MERIKFNFFLVFYILFTSLFAFNDPPGICLFKSKEPPGSPGVRPDNLYSYIGYTVNLYIRCKNHYNNSINNKKKTSLII